MFLGVKRNMKGYRLWDPENKKIMLSRHVTFDETSVLKIYRLSAGGENRDQGSIAAGGG